jgi:hypothetical protein
VIVIGLVLVSLLMLAFAGRGLEDSSSPAPHAAPHIPHTSRTSGWEAALFILLLLGIVSKRAAKKADDEDF